MEKRELWADITRIFAIYMVMVVHASVLPERLLPTTPLTPLIIFTAAKTCVPLFVMLSGMFLLPKSEPTKIFFRKRLLRLLLPWLFWTGMFCLWQVITRQVTVTSISDSMHLLHQAFISFWFLPMLFCLYLLTPALRVFVQHASVHMIAWVIGLWFVSMSCIPYLHSTLAFPVSTDNGLVRQVVEYSGYFLLGAIIPRMKMYHTTQTGVFLALFGIMWTIFEVVHMSGRNNGSFVGIYLDYIAPGVVFASYGIFLFFYGMRAQFEQGFLSRYCNQIAFLSQATLGIYLAHHLYMPSAQRLFGGVQERADAALVHIAGMSLFLFFISTLAVIILTRVPFLRRFVY